MWKLFNEFFIRLDRKPNNWEDRIILFAGYLVDNDKKASTVKSYISAIKAVLMADDVEVNVNRYLITSLTKACTYHNNHVYTRLPIRKNLLQLMIKKLPDVFDGTQEYLVIMYRTLFITAYYGLFRIGELTLGDHVLKARDVKISDNKRKVKFILRTSKTHWTDSKPQIIKIESEEIEQTNNQKNKNKKSGFCPFEELQRYIRVRRRIKDNKEQFFIFQDRSPVKPDHFRTILRKTLDKCGLDSSNYCCHGTRSGRAIDLVEIMHLDVATVKKLGRWKSNIIYQYLKDL